MKAYLVERPAREYDKDYKFEYCNDCGQKLDWSDEE